MLIIFNKFGIFLLLFHPLPNHLVHADKLVEVFMEFELFHDDQKLLESVKVRLPLNYFHLGAYASRLTTKVRLCLAREK